ncbi:tetratricopeptide repeat protein [Marinoscillum sp.]|uniref:tetratricopeptide repeat protein n=1 Tax=Marinoscillum sp. TaxID=2024838 RepID=UPI003BAAADFF
MIYRVLICFLILAGCTDHQKYPITEVSVGPDYYLTALRSINSEIRDKPRDVLLRKKRLYINQKLRWPEEADADLDFIISNAGLDQEIYSYGQDYFRTHHLYEKMLDYVGYWEELNGFSGDNLQWRVIALSGLGREREAQNHLWDLVQVSKGDPEKLTFAARTYLGMEDTTRALYAFSNLSRADSNHPSVLHDYVPLLLEHSQFEEAGRVLERLQINDDDPEGQMLAAKTFYELGKSEQAHSRLRALKSSEVYYRRAMWYKLDNQWDSATHYLDLVIQKDSSSRALLAKAEIYENQGYLNQSYAISSLVFEKDSTNSIAEEMARNVGRKIAYLRSLREREKRIPILDISSKKETENE